ncbi:putative serine/threonine-protein kinase [Vespula squamosa]|uniref:Serine/threonine-protein kinase n=1 Tax=Vespula squamosa TaxID=30214 RepID=A0ABD2AZV8_VESSQ
MDTTIDSLKENINSTDNNDKLDKLRKSYMMLKQKVCRSHELIKLYNDKLKECERMKIDLDLANKETKKMTTNYNGTLAKVIKLELQNTEYKKKIESLLNTIVMHETKIAGDQQHLQQLTCKLKELEDKHMDERLQIDMEKTLLQDKVKELERQMKTSNKTNNSVKKEKINKKQQGIEKGTYCCLENVIPRVDVAVNTIDVEINTRAEKNVMTDMTFRADKDNLYPLFCDKCEDLVSNPAEKICKTMTINPEIIQQLSSPTRSQPAVSVSIFSPEKDEDSQTNNKKRVNIQNSLEDINIHDNDSNLASVPLSSELSKKLSFSSQDPYMVREESLSNSTKHASFSSKFDELTDSVKTSRIMKESNNTSNSSSFNNLMHNFEKLKKKMKKLEKRVEKQSQQKKQLDTNYFPHSPYINYCSNEMLNHNFSLNMISTFLNGIQNIMSKNTHRRNKAQKRKYEPKVCKFSSKKIKLKRVQQNLLMRNNVWNVDSIKSCDERITRTDNSVSNDNSDNLSNSINNDGTSDNNSNVDKVKCYNNENKKNVNDTVLVPNSKVKKLKITNNKNEKNSVIVQRQTASDNVSNSMEETNSSSLDNGDCSIPAVISKKQSINDTSCIVEGFDLKSKNSKNKIRTSDKDSIMIINDLVPNNITASTFDANISINKSSVSDTKKQISIPLTKEFENTEYTVEEMPQIINNILPSIETSTFMNENKANDSTISTASNTSSTGSISATISDTSTTSTTSTTSSSTSSTTSTTSTSFNNTSPTGGNIIIKNRKRKLQISEKELNQSNLIEDSSTLEKNNKDICNIENNGTCIIKNTEMNTCEEVINNKSDVQITNPCLIPQKKQRIVHTTKINNQEESTLHNENLDANQEMIDKSVEKRKTNISDSTSTDEEKIDSIENQSNNINVQTKHSFTKRRNPRSNYAFATKRTRNGLMGRLKHLRSHSLVKVNNVELFNSNEPETVNNKSTNQSKYVLISTSNKNNGMEKNVMESPGELKTTSKDWTKNSLDDSFNSDEQIKSPDELVENVTPATSFTLKLTDVNKNTKDECSTSTTTSSQDSKSMQDKDISTDSNSDTTFERKTIESDDDTHSELCHKTITDEEDQIIKDVSFHSSLFALISPLKDDSIPDGMTEKFSKKEIKSIQDVAICPPIYPTQELNILRHSEHALTSEAEQMNNKSTKIKIDKNTISKEEFKLQSKFVDRNKQQVNRVSQEEEKILNSLACEENIEKRYSVAINVQKEGQSEMAMNEAKKDTSIDRINENGEIHVEIFTDAINTRMSNDDLDIQSHNVMVNDLETVSTNSGLDAKNINNGLINPITLLENHLKTNQHVRRLRNSKKVLKIIEPLCIRTDNFVSKQLYRIINDTDWSMSVHKDVVNKLSSICSVRIVAKGIVDFMLERKENNLDKSYTPPAPLMTITQQKIVTLLVDLEIKLPTVIKWVQAGIEYKIFRLNNAPMLHQIQNLIRLYIVLTRIQKDREKARMLCCDALYCLGLHAIPVIYTVLTCWPEIFPQFTENIDILPKYMAHFIMSLQANNFPQLYALKNLLSTYYKYKAGSFLTKNLVEESLKSLEARSNSNMGADNLKTAIILLAKKEGISWSYANIIQSRLLPNIINKKYLSMYEPFCLLGYLMRTFPVEDNDGIVKNVIEQLSDLIDSGRGSHDQQEGIVSALLSLSRHDIEKVICSVMKWIPSKSLRTTTIDQYYAFFRQRTKIHWRNYLKKLNKVYVRDIRL